MSVRCPDGHLSDSTDYCDTCGLPIGAAPSPSPSSGPGSGGPVPGPAPTLPVGVSPSTHLSGSSGGGTSSTEKTCPNCDSLVPIDDLFCEVCGYDFTTGARPAPVTAPGGLPVAGGGVASGPAAQLGGAAVLTPAPGGTPGSGGAAAPGGTSASGGFSPSGQAATLTWVAEVWVDPDWYATQESDDPCPSAGMPTVVPLWETSVLVGRRSASRNIHPQVDCGADHGVSRRHAQLTTDGQRWWAEDLQSSNGTFVGQAGAPIPDDPLPAGQRIEFAPGDRLYVGAWTRIVIRKATPDES